MGQVTPEAKRNMRLRYATKGSKKWRLQKYSRVARTAQEVLRVAPKINWPRPDDATVALLNMERALQGLM